MKKELPHFTIDRAYGGSQDWFTDPWMNRGGCGAATACDCCINLDLYFGKHLYPFDSQQLTRADYIRFSDVMKPYLHPRQSGIDTLELFIDGFGDYLRHAGELGVSMTPFSGAMAAEAAQAAVLRQIDRGLPIPYLNLKHHSPAFRDYEWHCYELSAQGLLVKAVTYGSWRWLNLTELWNTDRAPKGGMVLLEV